MMCPAKVLVLFKYLYILLCCIHKFQWTLLALYLIDQKESKKVVQKCKVETKLFSKHFGNIKKKKSITFMCVVASNCFSSRLALHLAPFIFTGVLNGFHFSAEEKHPLQHDAAYAMLHCGDGVFRERSFLPT